MLGTAVQLALMSIFRKNYLTKVVLTDSGFVNHAKNTNTPTGLA